MERLLLRTFRSFRLSFGAFVVGVVVGFGLVYFYWPLAVFTDGLAWNSVEGILKRFFSVQRCAAFVVVAGNRASGWDIFFFRRALGGTRTYPVGTVWNFADHGFFCRALRVQAQFGIWWAFDYVAVHYASYLVWRGVDWLFEAGVLLGDSEAYPL